MRIAQHAGQHSAYRGVPQWAYPARVEISSPRHLRRRHRLAGLIAEAGGVVALADLVETPKSHISALSAGRRGIGDQLARKLEDRMGKPPGWIDQDAAVSDEASEIALLFDALPEGPAKATARAVIGAVLRGDIPPRLPPHADPAHAAPQPAPMPAPAAPPRR